MIPKAEIELTPTLVRQLIDSQFPEFSELPISFFDLGWDNESFRLGTEYLIRLPRRKTAVELIHHEIKYLPGLTDLLPINIPSPIHVGEPSKLIPWNWTIVPWFDGKHAGAQPPEDSEAIRMIKFLQVLHQVPYTTLPDNPFRASPLIERTADAMMCIEGVKEKTSLFTDKHQAIWDVAVKAPVSKHRCFIHGDLHPRNIVIHEGKIEAVIDWGDLTEGDISTDLATLWMLFGDSKSRNEALAAYPATSDQILRAKGWAVFFGVVLAKTGLDSDPEYLKMGKFILDNLNQE